MSPNVRSQSGPGIECDRTGLQHQQRLTVHARVWNTAVACESLAVVNHDYEIGGASKIAIKVLSGSKQL
jgi:hypothetical protein